jgi:hypothetical protein
MTNEEKRDEEFCRSNFDSEANYWLAKVHALLVQKWRAGLFVPKGWKLDV